MRRLFLITLLLSAVMPMWAQGGTDAEILASIRSASESINAMHCSFTQTKHSAMMKDDAVSTGVMSYSSPSRLRWEYREPVNYVMDIDGSSLTIITEDGMQSHDTSKERMYAGISEIMLGCMSGQAITDKRLFRSTVSDADGLWVVSMTPVRRDMARMFKSVTLTFNPGDCLLRNIVMLDASDNSTTIEISDVSINE